MSERKEGATWKNAFLSCSRRLVLRYTKYVRSVIMHVYSDTTKN